MGADGDRSGCGLQNPTFRCIAIEQRRDALEALVTWGSPQSERQLANYLAANERGSPSISDTDVDSVHSELVHSHLPALVDAGLVEWDRESQRIETTDHPAIEDSRFQQLLAMEASGLETVLDGFAHEYRRLTLTVLKARESPLSLEALAREIHSRLDAENEPPSRDVDEILTALHHSHLPRLAEAGFVDYEPDAGRVSYAGDPVLEDVFAFMYTPSEALPEKAIGFFDDLREVMVESTPGTDTVCDWPHEWRQHYHG